MSNLILEVIHELHGYSHEDAGVVSGFFDDPESASACAERLRESCGIDVEVCGCQLSFINRRRQTHQNYPPELEHRNLASESI